MIGLNYLGKMGQLGNQMFQYAALKGIANQNGYEYVFPNHNEEIQDGLGNTLRIELFDAFNIKHDKLGYLQTSDSNNIQESHFHFDEKLFNTCPDHCCLIGFFQSPKYFEHIESEIRDDFKFRQEFIDDCQPIIEQFDNPIGLHIRRGDFLINSANHYNLSLKYYKKALDEFDSNRQVIIFSDDSSWCRNQPLFSDDRFLISEDNGPYHDLYLMSQCTDFIIGNSTYSWWGAWLSNNDNKIVLYPNKWFGSNNKDKITDDLFPKEWRMIDEN